MNEQDERRLAEIREQMAGYEPGDARVAARDLLAILDRERARSRLRYAIRRDIEEIEVAKALRVRAEDAERKLAAMHAAALDGAKRIESHLLRNDYAQQGSARRIMEDVLADTAPVAERHDREVEAVVLRRMAERRPGAAGWLHAEADRIERGDKQ